MKLTSSAFWHKRIIPKKYTCDGENISPPLQITGIPEGAAELVLIVDDPDAPRPTPWVHWTLWNIPPDTKEIREGEAPRGATEGMTDFGAAGYGGPCPHQGEHRYYFRLYALDIALDLNAAATVAMLRKEIEGHVLDTAELIGRYSRSS